MGGLKKDMMDLRCIKRTWWIGGHQMEHGGLVGIKWNMVDWWVSKEYTHKNS
jgi:hypothetical protein